MSTCSAEHDAGGAKVENLCTIEDVDQNMMDLNVGTFERLEDQVGLLHRAYNVELKKNPDSLATASARSNLIALLHTIAQIYGETAALGVKYALGFTCTVS